LIDEYRAKVFYDDRRRLMNDRMPLWRDAEVAVKQAWIDYAKRWMERDS